MAGTLNLQAAVSCRALTVGYPGLHTLEDCDLDFPKGKISCIVGGSGCGKSTLLKAIIGLLPPIAGEISLLGGSMYSEDENEVQLLRERIGVLFQNGALLNSISVLENVMIPLREHSRMPEELMEQAARLRLRQVGLEHAALKLPSELSGGMKKRAALARSMIMDPEIMFCDEPSAGLDPVTAAGLDELMKNINSLHQTTLIAVTHELASIRTIADRVVMLKPGGLVFQGSLDEAERSTAPEMLAFFGRRSEERSRGASLLERIQETT